MSSDRVSQVKGLGMYSDLLAQKGSLTTRPGRNFLVRWGERNNGSGQLLQTGGAGQFERAAL